MFVPPGDLKVGFSCRFNSFMFCNASHIEAALICKVLGGT